AAEAEMRMGQLAEAPSYRGECGEVGAALPGRIDRGGERMDERVHVRRREIVLLVPGCGRQHDVGEQGRAGHPEVQRKQEIQLALRRLVPPAHVPWPEVRWRLLGAEAAVRSQQVFEEILVALARGTEQVGPPQGQASRPILWGVRIFSSEPQLAA